MTVNEIRKSKKGIDYLPTVLRETQNVITEALLCKINQGNITLKIGRYKKGKGFNKSLESESPKSGLTLDNKEFHNLIKFLSENYEPLKQGVKKFITIDGVFSTEDIKDIKAIFENSDKMKVLDFVVQNNILPEDLLVDLELQKRKKAVIKFEGMLKDDLLEPAWQKWFEDNDWVLGSEFVRILDERAIDTKNIPDFLMLAYDGFLDIVEIKRPGGALLFWAATLDHGNYIPSSDLIKAITQSTKYLYEVEREANSVKFSEQVNNIKTVKPRCILVFGRSHDWNADQKEGYRILNASFHNLNIMTYDHVLARAKRMLGLDPEETNTNNDVQTEDSNSEDIPF